MVLVPETGLKFPRPAGKLEVTFHAKVTPAVGDVKLTTWVDPLVQIT